MMNMKRFGFALVGAVMGLTAFGTALKDVYKIPGYVHGVFDTTTYANMSQVPSTSTLIFPGATLEEMNRGIPFVGWFGPGAMNNPNEARSYFTHSYTNKSGELEFVLAVVQKYDDKYVKGKTIKLTQGADGVYGQTLTGNFLKTETSALTTTDFIKSIASDGTITYNHNTGGYYLYCLNMMEVVPTTPTLLFTNGVDEAVLTVDDIKDFDFSGIIVGPSVAPVRYKRVDAQNKHVDYDPDTGKATKIRLEMQLMDDKYLKCPVVELTDGEGGVYAATVKALYTTVAQTGATLGYQFLEDDGSVRTNAGITVNQPAGTRWTGNYGVGGLTATRANATTYTLDSSKTWSELTGSTNAFTDAQHTIYLRVTGDNPTLTFDTAVTVNKFVVSSDDNYGLTFAGTAPTCTTWDLRGTTGTVTFDDFTPVKDAATENILPNAAAFVRFNASLNGILPFNNASVAAPCAGIVLGGTQSFPATTVNKLAAKTIILAGTLNVTGAFTLPANCTNLVCATGSHLASIANLKAASDVTYIQMEAGAFVGPANSSLDASLRLVPATENGDIAVDGGANTTFTFAATNLVGTGRFCVTAGTFVVPTATETEAVLAVGNGGALSITVTEAQRLLGYTTPAAVREGGVIHFYDAEGTELATERPVMNVLPGAAGAIWSPLEDGGSFSADARWSTAATPADDTDVAIAAADVPFTITLDAAQSYGSLAVSSGAHVTFTNGTAGATLAVADLQLDSGASLTIPVASLTATRVTLGRGATLRLVGDGSFAGTITSLTTEGCVEIAAGTVKLASRSNTYTCGTRIAAGALAQLGGHGSFGSTSETNPITIADGGALDINGHRDCGYNLVPHGRGLELADGTFTGAVFNSGEARDENSAQLQNLTLDGPAVLTATAEHTWGFVTPGWNTAITWNIGTHTLTKEGDGDLVLCAKGFNINGTGTFAISNGVARYIYCVRDKTAQPLTATEATIDIGPNGTFDVQGPVTAKTIHNTGCLNVYPENRTDLTIAANYTGTGEVHIYGGTKTAVMNVSSFQPSTYYVHSGRLCARIKTGNNKSYKFNTATEQHLAKVIVSGASKYDVNGIIDNTIHVSISGGYDNWGAFVNHGADLGFSAQTVQLSLDGDSGAGGPYSFGLLAPGHGESLLELRDHLLKINMASGKYFVLDNTTITGTGTVRVDAGTLLFYNVESRGKDWTLNVTTNGTLDLAKSCTCSNLTFRGAVSRTQPITVYGTYLPASATLPNVTLTGSAAALDLSEQTTAWDMNASGTLAFADNTRVTVKTGARTLKPGDKLISWSKIPTNVKKWNLDAKKHSYVCSVRADGLYAISGSSILYIR